MNESSSPIAFLRTTAIGGLLFLLPLIVLIALVGQVVPIVMTIAEVLGKILPENTPGRITLLILLAIGIVLLLCFGAGLLARWSFSQRLFEAFEKKIVFFIPRYAILKDQMADRIGGDSTQATMKPVIVKYNTFMRIAFETDRDEERQLVTVYLPGSPDPWAGHAALVSSDRVEPLDTDFGAAVAICEQLGKGAAKLIPKPPSTPSA